MTFLRAAADREVAPVLPDYGGANLSGVIPALLQPPGNRPDWLPPLAAQAEQVVLLVLDGLGWLQLQDRLGAAPNLATMAGGPITSVVPTTTATALTSLTVGAPPAAHGVVGYRVVVEGPGGAEVMNVLKWKVPSGDARPFVDPDRFQLLDPFRGRPVPVVSKADFAGTAFTQTHQRGARQIGWYQASGMAVAVKQLVDSGEPLVYAYYDGVDRVAHVQGFGEFYDAELVAVDRIVGDLMDALPAEAMLVVTADHGQVQVGPNVVELDESVLTQVAMQSGEPRFRWLHTTDGTPEAADKLAAALLERYGDEAWVATYAEVSSGGWLGGPLPAQLRGRVGDVALVPFEPVAYLEPGEAAESRLICRHGSLTEQEMLVPLVAARGRLSA